MIFSQISLVHSKDHNVNKGEMEGVQTNITHFQVLHLKILKIKFPSLILRQKCQQRIVQVQSKCISGSGILMIHKTLEKTWGK